MELGSPCNVYDPAVLSSCRENLVQTWLTYSASQISRGNHAIIPHVNEVKDLDYDNDVVSLSLVRIVSVQLSWVNQ